MSNNNKKANKLRFIWIAFMTGVYTVWACLKIVSGSYMVKSFRPYVDRIMFKWASRLLGLIGVKVKVVGRQHLPQKSERPVIVMCNHSSLYDIPISAVALNTSLRMLTKKELFSIPIFGAGLRRGEFISIDRNNREQSLKDLERAKEKLLSGVVLWVAPEGTRSKDGKLGTFKRGGFHIALDSKALIVPLVVKNVHKVQAGNNLDLYLNQEIEVELCEPVDAADYRLEQRKELVLDVRKRMLDKLEQSEG
jgi:1-acyl-sn-glycerol-3-phosphate acyltransferase